MSRTLRVVLACALLLVATLATLAAASETTVAYYLPSPDGEATRHTAVFGPAVTATWVAGALTVMELVWLVLVAVRSRPRWAWWAAVAGAVLAVVVAVWSLQADRPDF
ncbi:hypothetical protein IF650_06845 [Cellulosimicrobium terreum]|nr:hypothetical protein [Cellulosimicrobium terreum]